MRRAHLGADAGLALGHDGIEETDHIDALAHQFRRHFLGQLGIAQHDRDDRMLARQKVETGVAHSGAEAFGIVEQAGAQIVAPGHHVECLQRGPGNRRRDRVGEKIGPRTLAQHVDDFLARCGEPAHRAAQRLAQRAGDDVDLAQNAAMFRRAAPLCAHEAVGVAIIDHGQRIILFRQAHDLGKVGDIAIHREHTVGHHQDMARAIGAGLFQARLQLVHVGIGIAIAFRLA